MASAEATELRSPRASERRALVDGPKNLGFAERVSLFICAMHKGRTLALLDGFADEPRLAARRFARQVMDWDSSTRQARLAHEFGNRADAVAQLTALVKQSPPLLKTAIAHVLPATTRSHVAELATVEGTPGPALLELARRLVREATRVSKAPGISR